MTETTGGRDVGARLGVLLAIADFPLLVAGYRAVIGKQPDMEVVAEVQDRDAVRDEVARTAARVVIFECLPFASAACASHPAIDSIRAANPAVKILAIDCRCGSEQFPRAIKAGADGFLSREAHPVDVVDAVRGVARGETYVSPTLVTRMVNAFVLRTPEAAMEDAFESLSERAREIFRLAASGRTNREIAAALQVSEQTVHNHRAAIMERLGFHDRVDLLRYALRHGLIQVGEL